MELAQWISLGVNIIILILSIGISLLVFKLIKIEDSGYKMLFVFYTLFWIPNMLCRNYTGVMHSAYGGAASLLWLPMMVYGLIGIFARPLYDICAFFFKSRKRVIYLVLIIEMITFIPIIIHPGLATNVIQSIGVGMGAGAIGIYELLFNEQYSKKRFFVTVSVLSMPPLIADFITSPLQSIVSTFGETVDTLRWYWVIGLIFLTITFIFGIFVKEKPNLMYKDNEHKEKIENKNDWFMFILLMLIGCLLSFIKFSNSGGIAQMQLRYLDQFYGAGTAKYYQGYLSMTFSFAQLCAGLLTGLFLVKKIGKFWTFTLGCVVWISYETAVTFILNPYAFTAIHFLNGFSYGIVYNLVLGTVLQRCFAKTNKISPMGVYQGMLSAGIMASTWFTSWMKADIFVNGKIANADEFIRINAIVDGVVIGCIVVMWILFCIKTYWDKKIVNQPGKLNINEKSSN